MELQIHPKHIMRWTGKKEKLGSDEERQQLGRFLLRCIKSQLPVTVWVSRLEKRHSFYVTPATMKNDQGRVKEFHVYNNHFFFIIKAKDAATWIKRLLSVNVHCYSELLVLDSLTIWFSFIRFLVKSDKNVLLISLSFFPPIYLLTVLLTDCMLGAANFLGHCSFCTMQNRNRSLEPREGEYSFHRGMCKEYASIWSISKHWRANIDVRIKKRSKHCAWIVVRHGTYPLHNPSMT